MNQFITSEEVLEKTVRNTVESILSEELPVIIRKAKLKPWMNTNELMEFTGWSRRTIQYLRDEKRIPFSQEGRKILYPTAGIELHLRENLIDPYKN